jgi:DNA-binding NarL/FixJ family response regulator
MTLGPMTTTVLLIEYPPAVRDALRARLSLELDLDIVGEADNASQGISLAHALEPDVVLIDAETPDLDAAEIVRALAQENVRLRIVVLSQHAAAIARGVTGTPAVIVTKHAGQASLVGAIRSAGSDRRPSEQT